MNDTRKIAEKMIEDGKKMIADAEAKLAALELPTYSVGDRFTYRNGKIILAGECTGRGVVAVFLLSGDDCSCDGEMCNDIITVSCKTKITSAELERIMRQSPRPVRYYDAQKKEKVDG